MKHLLLLSLLFLLPGMTIDVVIKPPVLPRPGKDFALFFAVKDYKNWKPLSGPIQDAKAIATELKTHYGFDTLIVRNPTLDQIYTKLEEYQRKTYAADAQLLIFFSGHGAFLENSREGFFIPKEGSLREKDPRFNSALPHARLSSYVENIPCPHILLAIDACYSGTFSREVAFRGNDERPGAPDPEAELQAKIKSYLEPKTRLFLTSGGKERTPDPSDFAARFLQGLQSNRRSGKRLLTVSQLYTNHLEEAIPKPKYGAFADNGYESNLLFVYTPPQQTTQNTAPDRDADGTPDASDQCPDEYGLASTLGCPDADEDGVPDKSDRCKYLRGEKKWQGCPDSDADGIPDHEDPCPNLRGPIGGNGCPTADRDGDGVPDSGDACPDQAGPARFRGCPDSDSDGVPDNDDKCPQEKGDPAYQGCPILYALGYRNGDFVKITGGTFQMGSTENDDEKPVHAVTVSDFYLNKYEVTVAQFKIFVDETGHRTDAENGDGSYVYTDAGNFEKKAGINWRHDAQGILRPSSQYNHPVIHVSWNDATAYCQWLSRKTSQSYRLPTEAEWEYAAGNGSAHTKYSWGNGNPSGKNGGNVWDEAGRRKLNWSSLFYGYDDGYVFTSPVGSFNSNSLGLYDMTGNVWEWCRDYYDENYYQSSANARDPQGPAGGSTRVVRGSSWEGDPNPDCSLVSHRDGNFPNGRDNGTGFRVLRR
jgi:formylglycine-generating enzyme required for sulfatase activity